MKYLILLLSVIIIAPSCKKNISTSTEVVVQDTLNSWVKIQIPLIADGVWFMDQNKGFLISLPSGIFSSTDGGQTWNLIPNTVPVRGFNIQFVDDLHGFAQGDYLWTSNDGGKTWTQKSSTSSAAYSQFLNTTVGFYSNAENGISSTQDSGNTWLNILSPATPSRTEEWPFYFLDSLRGFSLMNGNFQRTTDGGKNWEIISNVISQGFSGFYKMQFLDELTGYSGSPYGLLKTTDGGKSWINCFTNRDPQAIYQTPQFFDRNNGYFMIGTGIYKTTDGGKSWETSCRISTDLGGFYSMYFLDMNTGWATTYSGYILKLKT